MSESVVNVHFAKTHLSRLLEQVANGASVVIANAGRPVARLVPYSEPARQIAPPGSLAGRGFSIAPNFDAPIDSLFDVYSDVPPVKRVAEPGSPAPPTDAAAASDANDDRAQADGA